MRPFRLHKNCLNFPHLTEIALTSNDPNSTATWLQSISRTQPHLLTLDWASTPVMQHRVDLAQDLHERLFAWMTLGDERLLQAAYVAGVPRYQRRP